MLKIACKGIKKKSFKLRVHVILLLNVKIPCGRSVYVCMFSFQTTPAGTDGNDGPPAPKGTAAGGFTILSEKKLFLGQKVICEHNITYMLYGTFDSFYLCHK